MATGLKIKWVSQKISTRDPTTICRLLDQIAKDHGEESSLAAKIVHSTGIVDGTISVKITGDIWTIFYPTYIY